MRARVVAVFAALVLITGVSSFTIGASDARNARNAMELFTHPQGRDEPKSVPALLNYQGFLATADSGLVNETLAMTFRLYDSAKEGTELWSETHPAVEVSNGQFSVLLGSVASFPDDLFDGQILYLQLEVGAEVFAPRKAIVSVAYSQMADQADHATTADSADYATEAQHAVRADTASYSPSASPWSVSGDDVYRETGNVGIGTASPTMKLDVAGTVEADGFTINGIPIGTSTDSYWSKSGDHIHYSAGNVGVGTASPTARLHVVDGKGHEGSLGSADYAVYGKNSGGNEGHLGSGDHGAYGKYSGNGNEGILGGLSAGVEGYTPGEVVAVCAVYGEDMASGNKGGIGYRLEGVYGYNATTGNEGFLGGEGSDDYGVGGTAASATGKGVYGSNSSSGNFGWLGGDGEAVYGENAGGHFGNLGGSGEGVYGQSSGGDFCRLGAPGIGAEGVNGNGNWGELGASDYGVAGQHNNGNEGHLGSSSYAVYGEHISGNGGVIGSADYGVYGLHGGGNLGYLADVDLGAYGEHTSGNWGSLGGSETGVYGEHNNGNYGALGHSDNGAYGYNDSNGNVGFFGGSSLDYGAYGEHGNSGNWGVLGSIYYGAYGYNSSSGNYGFLGGNGSYDAGAYGQHSSGNYGHLGGIDQSVYGQHFNGNIGMLGGSYQGAYGVHSSGNWGYLGNENHGVYGKHVASGNEGCIGSATAAISGSAGDASSWAGFFGGKVNVSGDLTVSSNLSVAGQVDGSLSIGGNLWVAGNLSKGSGEFMIDHPLDPENKYLHHSFVESPDMMNVYNGNAILESGGEAWVELPEWFDALNRDFRYQLTCIGGFAPVYIAEKISGNRFKIAGGEPGMEVSWQVTGIRQDPYANLHRIPVEEDKPPEKCGYYLHPQAYGQSPEKSINFAAVPK